MLILLNLEMMQTSFKNINWIWDVLLVCYWIAYPMSCDWQQDIRIASVSSYVQFIVCARCSDGFPNIYVCERFLIIYLVCVSAHKAFHITEERRDILYMRKLLTNVGCITLYLIIYTLSLSKNAFLHLQENLSESF